MRRTFRTRCYDATTHLLAKRNRKPTVELDETGDVWFVFEMDSTLMLDVDEFYSGECSNKKLLDIRRQVMRMSYAARHGLGGER